MNLKIKEIQQKYEINQTNYAINNESDVMELVYNINSQMKNEY